MYWLISEILVMVYIEVVIPIKTMEIFIIFNYLYLELARLVIKYTLV